MTLEWHNPMILDLLLKKNPTLPVQQMSCENLTQQHKLSVSQHFTLCGCSNFDPGVLMLDLPWNHGRRKGNANDHARPQHSAPQEPWLVGLNLQKTTSSAGSGSVQRSQLYCKRSSEQINGLPNPVSTWKLGRGNTINYLSIFWLHLIWWLTICLLFLASF